MTTCAWCGQQYKGSRGVLAGEPTTNWGMCEACLRAERIRLTNPQRPTTKRPETHRHDHGFVTAAR